MPDNTSSPWWDDAVEAYVDRSLPEEDASRIEELLSIDAALAAEIEMAQAIRREFRALPEARCPDTVSDAVMRRVRRDFLSNLGTYFRQSIPGFVLPRIRPAFAMVVLLAIVLVSSWFGGNGQQADPDVAEALQEVKWTLAYLSEVTKQTGSAIRAEALEPLVLDRMQQAVDTFID